MARTIAWLLHSQPDPRDGAQGWLQRFQEWFFSLWSGKKPAITGPTEADALNPLGAALERALGRRYHCLAVNPRPGASLDEGLRELVDTDRVVLVPPLQATPRTRCALRRLAEQKLARRGLAHTALAGWGEQDFLVEARAWSHRMQCIARLKSQVCDEPPISKSPSFQLGLAESIRQAERDAGWTVPEDWIQQAVARAWDAIDGGQSIEAATTLPEPSRPGFDWIEEFVQPGMEDE